MVMTEAQPDDAADKTDEAQEEPSMEEILASIRRIISEDGEEATEEESAAAEAEAPKATAEPEPMPEPLDEPEPVAEAEPVVEPEPELEELVALDDGEEGVLELTDVVDDDDIEVELDDGDFDAAPAMPEPVEPPAASGLPAEGLVSTVTATAAADAFAGITQATRGVTLGNNQTLEAIVKELLRPMLKQWLDVNLAPMVQRIVEREVAKLAGRAEDSDNP